MDLSPKITTLKNKFTKIPNKDKLRNRKTTKKREKKKIKPTLAEYQLNWGNNFMLRDN